MTGPARAARASRTVIIAPATLGAGRVSSTGPASLRRVRPPEPEQLGSLNPEQLGVHQSPHYRRKRPSGDYLSIR